MKAAYITRYGGPEVLQLGDLPRPTVGPGDVLVDIHAASVNPVDFKIRDGDVKLILRSKFPLVLGNDCAGVVAAIGSGVTRFAVGDEVYTRVDKRRIGTFAEHIAVDEGALAKKPPSLSMVEAASLPLVGLTSWQALIDVAAVIAGQRVFIQAGAGGVGTFAIQLAKHLGAEVTTTASGAGVDLVTRMGADHVVDYKRESFAEVVRDQHVVLDTLGGAALQQSFGCLRPGGIVVSIAGPPTVAMARDNGVNRVLWPAFWLISRKPRAAARRTGTRYHYLFMWPSGAELDRISDLVAQRKIAPLVDRTFPLAEAREALAYVEAGRAKGKVVVTVR